MPIAKSYCVLLLVYIITLTSQINSSCKRDATPTTCPSNSFCNQRQYCECKEGWALECKLPVSTLTTEFQNIEISQSPKYFTIVPSSTDSIYVYRFEIATDVKTQLFIELYADEGVQTELTKDNLIGFLSLTLTNQPLPLFSPYMEFGEQPNGKIQQMILKVQLLNPQLPTKQQNKQTTPRELKKVNLMLKVDEIYFLNKETLLIIILSFVCFVSLTLLLGIGYCVYVWRRRPSRFRFLDLSIKHFDKLIPKRRVAANEEILEQTCPVCLLQFCVNDEIRETPCRHTFHPDCLDVWCKKKLTCPACRSDLSESSMKKQIKESNLEVLTKSHSHTSVGIQDIQTDSSSRRQSLREPLQIN